MRRPLWLPVPTCPNMAANVGLPSFDTPAFYAHINGQLCTVEVQGSQFIAAIWCMSQGHPVWAHGFSSRGQALAQVDLAARNRAQASMQAQGARNAPWYFGWVCGG